MDKQSHNDKIIMHYQWLKVLNNTNVKVYALPMAQSTEQYKHKSI